MAVGRTWRAERGRWGMDGRRRERRGRVLKDGWQCTRKSCLFIPSLTHSHNHSLIRQFALSYTTIYTLLDVFLFEFYLQYTSGLITHSFFLRFMTVFTQVL